MSSLSAGFYLSGPFYTYAEENRGFPWKVAIGLRLNLHWGFFRSTLGLSPRNCGQHNQPWPDLQIKLITRQLLQMPCNTRDAVKSGRPKGDVFDNRDKHSASKARCVYIVNSAQYNTHQKRYESGPRAAATSRT